MEHTELNLITCVWTFYYKKFSWENWGNFCRDHHFWHFLQNHRSSRDPYAILWHVVKALTNFRHSSHFHFFLLSRSPLCFKRPLCHFIWIFAKTLVGVRHICQICHLCQNSPLNPLVFFHWICHCWPVFTVFVIRHFCHNPQSPRGHVSHPNWIFAKPMENFCQICRSHQIRHFCQLLYFTGSTSHSLIYAPVNVGGAGHTRGGWHCRCVNHSQSEANPIFMSNSLLMG